MNRFNLTDSVMLQAAQRRLDEHLAMRPATSRELEALAADQDADAAEIEASASGERTPTISEIMHRGFHGMSDRPLACTTIQHLLGRRENARVKSGMMARRDADKCRAHAAALRTASRLGDGAAYRETLDLLIARRDHYARLVAVKGIR